MLIGDKIILRPLKMQDVENVNRWRNDVEITRLTMGIRFPKTIEMDEDWFNQVLRDKSNRNIYWGIDIKESHEFIGLVSLTNIDYVSGNCFFGIMIANAKYRGKRYGSEASSLAYNYAFKCLNLRKISKYIVDNNHQSLEILQKRTYEKEEGCLKNHYYYDGKYHDVIILSLFRDDYYKSV